MTGTIILGIDPGGTTGLCTLAWNEPDGYWWHGWQRERLTGADLVEIIHAEESLADPLAVLVACEDYIVRGRAARATYEGGAAARELVGAVRSLPVATRRLFRTAATVKPWATDARLTAMSRTTVFRGRLLPGQPHATDAARHALYAGVRDLGWPDPLSKSCH